MWCPIMKIHVRSSVDYLGGLVQDCSISIANTGDAAVFHLLIGLILIMLIKVITVVYIMKHCHSPPVFPKNEAR